MADGGGVAGGGERGNGQRDAGERERARQHGGPAGREEAGHDGDGEEDRGAEGCRRVERDDGGSRVQGADDDEQAQRALGLLLPAAGGEDRADPGAGQGEEGAGGVGAGPGGQRQQQAQQPAGAEQRTGRAAEPRAAQGAVGGKRFGDRGARSDELHAPVVGRKTRVFSRSCGRGGPRHHPVRSLRTLLPGSGWAWGA